MATPALDTINFYQEDDVQAWITSYANDLVGSLPPYAPATRWWAPYTYIASGSPKILKIPLTLQVPRMQPYNGRNNLQMGITKFATFTRQDPQFLGYQQQIERLQQGDWGALAISPQAIAHAIDVAPDIGFGAALNAGLTTPDWTGTDFLVLSSASASDQKPINPGMPALGKYTNARENFAFTSDNISTLCSDIATRKGMDGRYLGNEQRDLELWIPPTKSEDAKQIIDRIEWTQTSGTGGITRAYKRMPYRVISDMRTDMFAVVAKPQGPWELLFVYMMGANPNSDQTLSGMPSWQVQQGQDMTPHRQLDVIDTQHYLYQTSGVVGFKAILNETYKLFHGQLIAAAYTGAAS